MLVTGTWLPIIMLGTWCIWMQYCEDRTRMEADLVQHARSMALLVDREFDLALSVAKTLARSPSLRTGDLADFTEEARQAEEVLTDGDDDSVLPVTTDVFDRGGRRLLESGRSGAPTGGRSGTDAVGDAIASGREQISNYFVGRLSGEPRVSVVAPVLTDSSHTDMPATSPGAVTISLPRKYLLHLAMSVSQSGDVVISIRDRNGVAVARSERDAELAGQSTQYLGLLSTIQTAGLITRGMKRLDGTPVEAAVARGAHSGYFFVVSISKPLLLAPLWASLLRSVVCVAAALLFGIALALILASRMSRAFGRVLPLAGQEVLGQRASASTGMRESDLLVVTLAKHLRERRRADKRLLASEARFRTIAEAMPQIVWSTTPDGTLEYCNGRMLVAIGQSLEQAKQGAIWKAVHTDDRAFAMAQWGRSLATGAPYDVEYRLRHADGSYRWMLHRALPVHDQEDEIERWFATCTDISEIMAARESLSRSREQLEVMVEARTRDLAQTQEKLARSARMKALGELVGGVAHDFNNVIHAILGGVELIEQRAEDAADVRRLSRMVLDASERGKAITNRMLAFSRSSDLKRELIDTNSLLKSLQEILQATLGAGIDVQIRTAERMPKLIGDCSQLETVLINLATNARDAMGGRGKLLFTAEPAELTDPATSPLPLDAGRYMHFAVHDEGHGMDGATLARVCEPFFTTKPVGQGTGLGLSMAHGFAEQCGGGLHIESNPGLGTVVHLWLPLGDLATRQVEDVRRTQDSLPSAAARIMLVDDDPVVLDITCEQLTEAGFAVLTFPRGEPAFEYLATGAPIDALISDFSMPGMDGVTLIRDAQRLRPGLPTILCTGYIKNATELAVSGAMSGSFSLLHKPLRASQLIGRLHEVLDTAAARVEVSP